jgi:hypothetical protein
VAGVYRRVVAQPEKPAFHPFKPGRIPEYVANIQFNAVLLVLVEWFPLREPVIGAKYRNADQVRAIMHNRGDVKIRPIGPNISEVFDVLLC